MNQINYFLYYCKHILGNNMSYLRVVRTNKNYISWFNAKIIVIKLKTSVYDFNKIILFTIYLTYTFLKTGQR